MVGRRRWERDVNTDVDGGVDTDVEVHVAVIDHLLTLRGERVCLVPCTSKAEAERLSKRGYGIVKIKVPQSSLARMFPPDDPPEAL